MAKVLTAFWTAVYALTAAPLSPIAAAVRTTPQQTVARSEVATVKVTYQGGDVAAGPQTMTGRDDATGIFLTAIHTVNIDFAKFLSDACVGERALATRLHKLNPISAIHVLELNIVDPATSGGIHIRWGNIPLDGKLYDVLFSNFKKRTNVRELMVKPAADASKPQETTDPKNWDGYVLEGGRFYVVQTSPRQVQLNCPGVVELEILIAR
jgi:hypothetical protein